MNGIRKAGLVSTVATLLLAAAGVGGFVLGQYQQARASGAESEKLRSHLARTEPLIDQFQQTRTAVAVHGQAIVILQADITQIKNDLRDIRDALYGRRPLEPSR